MDIEDDEIPTYCPMCGGPSGEMGTLGKTTWMQCRDCGWQFTQEPGREPNENNHQAHVRGQGQD